MQSSHRSSKGKGRARDADYAQSFASLSLSEYDDSTAPRSDLFSPSYTSSYVSSYEPPYIGDELYTHAPTQSSPAAYGGAAGLGNSYPATSSTSPTGGYEYPTESSRTSNHSGYTEYDTASITSSSGPSYGGGSVSGWSDAHSRGTAQSSVPSAQSRHTDVNNTIHRQRPPNEVYQLPCEFHNLTGCNRVFPGDDEQGWMDHHEEHLQSKFPTRLICWFCSDHRFDARDMFSGDVRSNFNARMHHIRDHLVYDGYRPEQMRMDGLLVKHLLDQNLIDRHTYESIVNPNPASLPPIPGNQSHQGRSSGHSGHSSHKSHKSHKSHHRLPQVDEEIVAGPSSRHHHPHRPEHRREHDRDRGSHKHRSR